MSKLRRALLTAAALLLPAAGAASAAGFDVTNLVTNDQSAHPAQITDPNLQNAWGISSSPTSPFWVSDNASGLATLYSVNPVTNATAAQALVVSIPGDGSATGQVFNSNASGTPAFNNDLFLFASEDGTISGWRPALGTAAETLVPGSTANVYKGTTLATTGGHSYLYSANFRTGSIDVLRGDAAAPALTGSFNDPGIPAGFAPFNVQNLGGELFVTYARQDAAGHDDVAGPGNGFVDAFDLQGDLLGRIGSGGTLNSPWGLAIAPSSFGSFAGDLLVGNFGDGTINAFSLLTDSFVGQLTDANGQPIHIPGLWGLRVGNDGSGGSSQQLYFSAGPDGETNGLFGVITPAPEPTTLAVLGIGLLGLLASRRPRMQR